MDFHLLKTISPKIRLDINDNELNEFSNELVVIN